MSTRGVLLIALTAGVAAAGACTHRVQVDPIDITLNVNITQEVRVRLQPEVEELIAENEDLF